MQFLWFSSICSIVTSAILNIMEVDLRVILNVVEVDPFLLFGEGGRIAPLSLLIMEFLCVYACTRLLLQTSHSTPSYDMCFVLLFDNAARCSRCFLFDNRVKDLQTTITATTIE